MDEPIRTKSYTADRRAMLATFWLWNYWVRVPILIAVYALMAIGLEAAAGPGAGWSLLYSCLGFTAVMLALRFVFLRRSLYRKDLAPLYDLPRHLEVSEEGLHAWMGDGAESRAPWSHYRRAFLRPGCTFLRRVEGTLVFVPNAAFSSKADLESFHALLRSKGLLKG